MCIIAIKPQGKKMFDDTTIKTMFINNPDGAGYMYYDRATKKVCIKKGFMTCTGLLDSLHSKDFTDTNLILHFRIGTSGLNDKLNCHPYPLYQINDTKCSCELAMAHNGILKEFTPPKDSKINDTQTFIKEVLNNLKKGFLFDSDKVMLIQKLIGTNKLAFLTDKNQVLTMGNFITDDGYQFSNDSYHPRSLYYTPTKSVYKTIAEAKGNTKGNTKSVSKATKSSESDSKCVSKTYKLNKQDKAIWDDYEPNEFWDYWDSKYPWE